MSISLQNIVYFLTQKFSLNVINLKLVPGEMLAVIGPNGSGKSTLLNLLAGDIIPTKGEILYADTPIRDLALESRAHFRSVMSQSQDIVYNFLAGEVVEMGTFVTGKFVDKKTNRKKLDVISTLLGLVDILKRRFRHLSAGEKQLIQLARAMIQVWEEINYEEPKFILLDEPTSNLDLPHEIVALSTLKNETRKGLGVMVILHDLNLAAHFADRIVILSNGRIFAEGRPREILTVSNLRDVYGLEMTVTENPLRIRHF